MAKHKIKVGVVFGGRSGEHEVSLVSATSIIKALDRKKYQVIQIGVTKNGRWIIKEPLKTLKSGKIIEKGTKLLAEEILNKCEVIFPMIHGSYGEDGTLQGMLEMAGVAYVGAGVLASAVGMDKIIQKELFAQANLPIVKYEWFLSQDWQRGHQDILRRIEKKLKYPVFTKPANSGSSVGIGKCHNYQELIQGINDATRYDRKGIVEQGIEGIREIEVSVLGNDEPKASVPGEIIASNEFYDYDAKYVDGKSQVVIPAKLLPKTLKEVQNIAVMAFKTLDLAGMARVDFFVTKGHFQVYLNEVNTLPGFTSISMYPKLWAASGLPYPKLLDKLIKLALERHQERNKLSSSYKPKEDWYK